MSADHHGPRGKPAASSSAAAATPDGSVVWLPVRPERIPELPPTLEYAFWDGGPDFPTDPARCSFYCVPYAKGREVALRPLSRMSQLRVVQTLTAGVDAIEPALDGLHAGVRLCNARGVHDASTAELALTLILSTLRDIPGFVRAQDAAEWRPGFRPALADSSVLIVGYGAIGSAVEERLRPFECAHVARVARAARDSEHGPVRALDALPSLLPEADVVVLSTPLTDATRHLVDADFLARMKDGALLVNVARGAVVDTEALLAEVSSGRLRAALDVTDPEPLPSDHPLWHVPGVLVTPHVGGPTTAFLPRATRLLTDQLQRFATGLPLRHTVAISGTERP